MHAPQNIIALIFDFDDTLTDESTTKLLEAYGIDTKDFWQNRVSDLTKAGWDSALAYLRLILDHVGEGKPFGDLRNQTLRAFGSALQFYPGLPDLFADLRATVAAHRLSRPAIEYYIISGGLEEIIKGSSIAQYFDGIYGCRFCEEGGRIRHVMNSISFTEKTKYIFAINKGVPSIREDPYAVNRKIEQAARRIPIENMI
ncbi:MAG TPA: hypothetical protein VK395_04950 [Gemmataceae bacterium]|nr:hypothetical protein [Gemmataceae bacterium]